MKRSDAILILIVLVLFVATGGARPLLQKVSSSLARSDGAQGAAPAAVVAPILAPTQPVLSAVQPVAPTSQPVAPLVTQQQPAGSAATLWFLTVTQIVSTLFVLVLCLIALTLFAIFCYRRLAAWKQRRATEETVVIIQPRPTASETRSPVGARLSDLVRPLSTTARPALRASFAGSALSGASAAYPAVGSFSGASQPPAVAAEPEPRVVGVMRVEDAHQPQPAPSASWRCLSVVETLQAIQVLGGTPRQEERLSAPTKRALELQLRFNALAVAYAEDWSLIVFEGVTLSRAELEKIASPQPVVLDVNRAGQPVLIVGLFHPSSKRANDAAVIETAPQAVVPAGAAPRSTTPPTRSWDDITQPVRLADDLPLSIHDLVSQVVVVMGRRRTGKSHTIGVLLEQLCEQGFPFAVIDPEGEFYSLRTRYPVLIVGKAKRAPVDCAVSIEHAKELARWAHTHKQQLVVDISGYEPQEQIQFVRRFCDGVWEASNEANPAHCFGLILDEAHMFFPEHNKTEASDTIDNIVLRGGKWGITVVLGTQRSARISKTAITQQGIALLHLADQKLDLDAYEAMLPVDWTRARIADTMQTFKQGTVLAKLTLNDQPSQVRVVQVNRRSTPHLGRNPSFAVDAQPLPVLRLIPADGEMITGLTEALQTPTKVADSDEQPDPAPSVEQAADESTSVTTIDAAPAVTTAVGSQGDVSDPRVARALAAVADIEAGDLERLIHALKVFDEGTDGTRKVEGVSAAVEIAWSCRKGGGKTFVRGARLLRAALGEGDGEHESAPSEPTLSAAPKAISA